MLSKGQVDQMEALSASNTVDAFFKEQALRSRASKAQQVRVYGYWKRGPVAEGLPPLPECDMGHMHFSRCQVCGYIWAHHSGHVCPDGIRMAIFDDCGMEA